MQIQIMEQMILLLKKAIVLLTALISLYTPQFGGMGEPLPDYLKIKVPKDRILISTIADDLRCSGKEEIICENVGKMVKYKYISTVEVPQETGEDISKRTKNTKIFPKGNETEGKFYTGEPFYKDNDGKWYQTETATTTIEAFNTQTVSIWDSFFGKAYATDYYAGAGDGLVRNTSFTAWNTVHDASSATAYPTSSVDYCAMLLSNTANWIIGRAFFPIDTSAIPAGSTINNAILNVVTDDDSALAYVNESDYIGIVQTTQLERTTLASEDFDQCGDIHNPTVTSTKTLSTFAAVHSYNAFTFDATGRGWVKSSGQTSTCGDTPGVTCLGARVGQDIYDDPASLQSGGWAAFFATHYSENTGTDLDPYLSVTYTEASAAVPQIIQDDIFIE